MRSLTGIEADRFLKAPFRVIERIDFRTQQNEHVASGTSRPAAQAFFPRLAFYLNPFADHLKYAAVFQIARRFHCKLARKSIQFKRAVAIDEALVCRQKERWICQDLRELSSFRGGKSISSRELNIVHSV